MAEKEKPKPRVLIYIYRKYEILKYNNKGY
jgi:hypothetical protein